MNQKAFAPIAIILIIAGVLIIGGGVYWWQKANINSSPITNQQQSTNPQSTQKTVNWESLIPDIKIALQQAFPKEPFQNENISIYKKADITGDGIPEALVNTGFCGATTCEVVLMRIENNKPIVARFKQKDGEISYLTFSDGSGGAGRYGNTAEILTDKSAVYSAGYSAYGENNDSCEAEVYQWNIQTKLFEFNTALSSEIQNTYCSKVCDAWGKDPDLKQYFEGICR